MKIKKHLLITLLLISPFLPQAQSPFYAFDMSDFLTEMTKSWSIGNTEEEPYFEVSVFGGLNMNGHTLEIMNSKIIVYGDSTNTGTVIKRFETSDLVIGETLSEDIAEYSLPQVIMYPNPSRDYVNFKGELISKLVIYDALGKIRKKSKPNSSNFAINISNLPSGIYMIQLWCENNQGLVKKLIIR